MWYNPPTRYKKAERRKTQYLGSGAYFKVKRVLPGKGDLRKRVTLSGKVVKVLKNTVTGKEAAHIRRIMTAYSAELKKAGIPAIELRMVVTITKKPGKLRITFVQPFVAEESMLHNYLKTCPAKEAVSIFEKMLSTADRMHKWSENNPGNIGLDM
ncbi:Uncharacterised protein [uncultured archaeon]|nr:Uncharacterised protein [uncultured archaeon]